MFRLCETIRTMSTARIYLSLVGACAVAMSIVLPGLATGFDRTQYAVIVERNIFGEKPKQPEISTEDQARMAKAAQPQIAFSATLKLTMLRRDDNVGEVCAMEDSKNPAWHAYLGVGESQDGISIKKIDLDAKGVLLSKDGRDDEWIFLGGASGAALSRASIGAAMPVTPIGGPRSFSRGSRHAPIRTANAGPVPSPLPKVTMTPQDMEQMDTHLQEVQKNIIRSGGDIGPVLPVELSKDTDDQLVKEGFLPPPE